MSKKFTYAQQHYAVHELETLAILEALLKWEDKLLRKKLHIITDHKALEFFKTQVRLSSQQRHWTDYMSKFKFDIMYIKEELNKVADCLSRYFERRSLHCPTYSWRNPGSPTRKTRNPPGILQELCLS